MIVTFSNNNAISPELIKKPGAIYIGSFPAWYYYLISLMDFLWLGEVDGNYLISSFGGRRIEVIGKDFTGNYIPATSLATFKLDADADLIADDTDNLWFTGGVQNNTTVTDIITDNERTIVKREDNSPSDIYFIGLLKLSAVLNSSIYDKLTKNFWLSFLRFHYINEFGRIKYNSQV